MALKMNKTTQAYFVGCKKFPDCRSTFFIGNPTTCTLSQKICDKCSTNTKKIYLFELGKEDEETEFKCLYNCLDNPANKPVNNLKKKNKGSFDFDDDFQQGNKAALNKRPTARVQNVRPNAANQPKDDDLDDIDFAGLFDD